MRKNMRKARRDFRTFPFALPAASDAPDPPPHISVILPVYNHSQYLERSIESVLSALNIFALELIVVDDGSSEDIASRIEPLLRHYSSSNRSLKCFRRPHRGLAAALSFGFSQSTGRYLSWTSADNNYLPGALDCLALFLTANPLIGLAYANVCLIDEHGNPIRNSNYRVSDQDPSETSNLKLPLNANSLTYLNDNFINACFLYRREAARFAGFYSSEKVGFEDYAYWMTLSHGFYISHVGVDSPLYEYRLHRNSLSNTLEREKWEQQQYADFRIERQTARTIQKALSGDIQAEVEHNVACQRLNLSLRLPSGAEAYKFSARIVPPNRAKPVTFYEQLLLNTKKVGTLSFAQPTDNGTHETLPVLHLLPTIRENLILRRARDSDFGAVVSSESDPLRILLLIDEWSDISYLATLISSCPDLLFILLSTKKPERDKADKVNLHLRENHNLRIIDIQSECESGIEISQIALMNVLGSVDAMLLELPEHAEIDQKIDLLAKIACAAYAALPVAILRDEPLPADPILPPGNRLPLNDQILSAPHLSFLSVSAMSSQSTLSAVLIKAALGISVPQIEQWLLVNGHKEQRRKLLASYFRHKAPSTALDDLLI